MLITNNIDSNVTEINACNPLTLHPNNDNFLKITGPSKKLTIDKKSCKISWLLVYAG